MAVSFFRKIQKILEKPEMPAHIRARQVQVVIPWYERLWNAIRPPSSSAPASMNTSQRRIIWAGIVTGVVLGAGYWGFRYVSDAPIRSQSAFEAGMVQMGPGNFDAAIAKFTESINIRETAVAYLQRGNAYTNQGRFEQALADWSKAIQLDPNLGEAYTARGTYYRVHGDLPRALADLERSLQIAPTVDGFFQRGQVYSSLGQYQQAINDYTDAINIRVEAPYVYLARAAAKKALGDEAGFAEDQAEAQHLQRSDLK